MPIIDCDNCDGEGLVEEYRDYVSIDPNSDGTVLVKCHCCRGSGSVTVSDIEAAYYEELEEIEREFEEGREELYILQRQLYEKYFGREE